jgi:hypothetical protein
MAFPGAIWVDQDAAGYGWYLDASPATDGLFPATAGNGAFGKVDLLTVVEHELGHELGLADTTGSGLMGEFLPTGVRRVPAPERAPEGSPGPGSVLPGVPQSLGRVPLRQVGAYWDGLLGLGQAPPDGALALPTGAALRLSGQIASVASTAPVLLTPEKSSGEGTGATPAGTGVRDRLSALDAALAADPESLWPEVG